MWDGKLLKEWSDEMLRDIIPLAYADDGTVVQTWKQVSFLPGVGQVLSLPPHMRLTHGGIYTTLTYVYSINTHIHTF